MRIRSDSAIRDEPEHRVQAANRLEDSALGSRPQLSGRSACLRYSLKWAISSSMRNRMPHPRSPLGSRPPVSAQLWSYTRV